MRWIAALMIVGALALPATAAVPGKSYLEYRGSTSGGTNNAYQLLWRATDRFALSVTDQIMTAGALRTSVVGVGGAYYFVTGTQIEPYANVFLLNSRSGAVSTVGTRVAVGATVRGEPLSLRAVYEWTTLGGSASTGWTAALDYTVSKSVYLTVGVSGSSGSSSTGNIGVGVRF